ncbi:uncharacterized protein PpBr36_09558 [Pyricularia pennisetigena]|uniref:uncharacterized protein n=1 Tax=Pyricularia pennisetigena TaxID=1578925 RepID=UPI001151BFEC|nr:uncharacterized protein PpBr36_09558 [Pyricularia pennisetigena]TLS21620.1 hypothetical protein PpBr36_09558 [Pyricularia pennisetigena]
MASITKLTKGIARKAFDLIRKKKNGNQPAAPEPTVAVRWLAEEPAQFLGPFCAKASRDTTPAGIPGLCPTTTSKRVVL